MLAKGTGFYHGAIFGHCHIVNKDGRDLLADATYQEQVISDKKCCFSY